MPFVLAIRFENPVSRRRAHRQELAPVFFAQMKMPMPLQVHRREGEPCPRCGATIEAVFFAEHQMNYCPEEQTGGRVLKDRRLSRLLK